MKKAIFLSAIVLTALMGSTHAAVEGGSSNPNTVDPKKSTAIPFGPNKPGLSLNKSIISINLEDGPIKHIRQKYANTPINNAPTQNVDGTLNPKYLMMKDVNPVLGFFNNQTLGQIWYEKRENNTEVFSVRQIADPIIPIAPKFGGLVIAKVPDLPSGTSVYFGEWAPRAGSPTAGSSTDLNLNHADHTVWFVGENPTGSTKNLASATYKVLGVNKHVPGQNDFYTGTLNAIFGAGETGSLSGSLTRTGSPTINFTDTDITNSNGTFSKGSDIKGQFYGVGAAAIAGYAKNGTDDRRDDVAFGGNKQ